MALLSISYKIPELDRIRKTIRANSFNLDVKLFLFKQLLTYDEHLAQSQAWEIVKDFQGNGAGTSTLEEEYWIEFFKTPLDNMLYAQIEEERINSEKDVPSDINTLLAKILNPIGRHNMAVSSIL